jgi:hypothetical protein
MSFRFIPVEQGSPEWFQERCGRLTASMFSTICEEIGGLNIQQKKFVDGVLSGIEKKEAATQAGYKAIPSSEIITRALNGENTVDYSDAAKKYACDLSLERISEEPYGVPVKSFILARGHEMEVHARRIYEARTGFFVTENGVCVDDYGYLYSSDGIVEDDGLLEIKSPIDSLKIEQLFKSRDNGEYFHQCQGGLWITNRKWIDLVIYVPALEKIGKDLTVTRIVRDEEFIDNMVIKLHKFSEYVKEKETFFRSLI